MSACMKYATHFHLRVGGLSVVLVLVILLSGFTLITDVLNNTIWENSPWPKVYGTNELGCC